MSERSDQPMTDRESGLVLSFNGEIYNYRVLKKELANLHDFKTSSDTEVLLAGLKHWGFDKTLQRLRGMFAFIAYDPKSDEVMAARDPMGEKPFCYGLVAGDLLMSSDMRVFFSHPHWSREISLQKLKSYFSYRFVPHPGSLFPNVFKLPPGHCFRISKKSDFSEVPTKRFWHPQTTFDQESISSESVREAIENSVKNVVETSDARMGCFLSGGIDSSLVTTLATKYRSDLIAFTIQFEGSDFDESKKASELTRSLGLEHRVVPYGFQEFQKSFFDLIDCLDEPSAVSSIYPLSFLAQVARKEVKVCLGGDGGDELFAGYNRHHFWVKSMEPWLKQPNLLRTAASTLLNIPGTKSVGAGVLSMMGVKQASTKFDKIKRSLNVDNVRDYYNSVLVEPNSPLGEVFDLPDHLAEWIDDKYPLESLQLLDLLFYLPNDVLNKVDKATMAHGLESRAPLLDIDVYKLAQRLSHAEKVTSAGGKLFLRNWLDELNPSYSQQKAKQGFTPVYQYLTQAAKSELLSGSMPSSSSFSLFSLTHWLMHHEFEIIDS